MFSGYTQGYHLTDCCQMQSGYFLEITVILEEWMRPVVAIQGIGWYFLGISWFFVDAWLVLCGVWWCW